MAIIGNFFLALVTVFFLYSVSLVYGPEPPRSGDAAVGYTFTVMLLHLLLLAGLVVVAVAVAWTGGFDWISPQRGVRLLVVALGLVGIVLVSALAALFKYESGPIPWPYSLKAFTLVVPALLPAVLILGSAILLNEGLRTAVPPAAVKGLLIGVTGLAAVGIISALGGWLSLSAQNAARAVESHRQDELRWNQERLQTIAACDATSLQVANILVFTSPFHDPEVRRAALEKVKSNPRWQQHLIELIDNQASLEVFQFMAHNDVEDKALFPEALRRATLQVADYIRNTIRRAWHPSNLYEDQFAFDVERVLLTLEKFQGMGVDFLPAVREMRAALDEPGEHKTVTFKVGTMLNNWIKIQAKKQSAG